MFGVKFCSSYLLSGAAHNRGTPADRGMRKGQMHGSSPLVTIKTTFVSVSLGRVNEQTFL